MDWLERKSTHPRHVRYQAALRSDILLIDSKLLLAVRAMLAVKFSARIADSRPMEFVAAGLSTIVNVFMLALFIAGVLKLFQIHTTLTEIKDALKSGSSATRAAAVPPPTSLHTLGSGEEMLRALAAEMNDEELKSASPH
jgi:hypothetical protein